MNGYYGKTFAYVMFMPILLLIAVFSCLNGIIDNIIGVQFTIIFSDAVVVLFVVLCFLAMFLYGYRSAKKYRNPEKNPEIYFPLSELYIPLIFPVIWYLLWTAVMNIFDVYIIEDFLGILILIFIVVNPYAALAYNHYLPPIFGLDDSHSILIYNLMYYGILILGFAAGERFSAHKIKNGAEDNRKLFVKPKKSVIIFFTVVIAAYSLSEIVLYQYRKNVVPSAHKAYGFAYEDGYSSSNLYPYHVENESNILAVLDEPSTFTISSPNEMPVLDGAEAAYPVYAAFANACYDDIANIQYAAEKRKPYGEDTEEIMEIMPVQFHNTIYAYEKLLHGEVDICFGARLSAEQMQLADKHNKEIILTSIAKEGFVFFVNDANPVDALTTEQIKDIYSGKITNWRKVGGENEKILAYQRPEGSGSQTMMEYFMGDTPLKAALEAEYYASMGGILRDVAAYDNGKAAIGYSFRYYASIMTEESSEGNTKFSDGELGGIKFLAVDGVYPDEKTIRSGEYPLTTELYAITVIDKSGETGTYTKDTIEPFLEWMTSPQGQKIVADTGYVTLE